MGRAMALGLAAAGARVSLVDIDAAALEEAATETAKVGAAVPMVADISKPDAAERVVERTRSARGASWEASTSWSITPASSCVGHQKVRATRSESAPTSVNRPGALDAPHGDQPARPVFMARAAVGPMLAQRWGRIIGVTTSHTAMVGKGTVP
jgi:NAD(P)-dependent dehydrogenase (short-subunit alcohol dehydrogenase family)